MFRSHPIHFSNTMDNLTRRGKILVNACPMCLEEEETVDHLTLNCRVANMIWNSVLGWFSYSWAFPRPIQDLIKSWKSPISHPRGKEMWNVAFLAVIWTLWKERSARCFEGVEKRCEFLWEKIKFSVASWVSINPIFQDSSVDQIMRNWKETDGLSVGLLRLYFSFALLLQCLFWGCFGLLGFL